VPIHPAFSRSGLPSDSIAGLPNEKHIDRDRPSDHQHPVLALEAKKGEMLNQKLHHARPNFRQSIGLSEAEIYYFHIF
jgi:hypothetical protein